MKNRVILIIVGLLFAIAIALYITQRKGTIKQELKDFAVADTGAIDKLFLADRADHQITLEKKSPGHWIVNAKYNAREEVINNLLNTILKVAVKAPVAKAAHNAVVAQLATSAVKVEIYQQGELVKTYYVGEPTTDYLGTYMLLEKSSVPFIMHIPGFDGYLSTRYTVNEEDWRERVVFNYPANTIASIEIVFSYHPEYSFLLNVKEQIVTQVGGKEPIKIDANVLNSYLSFYQHTPFEIWEKKMSPQQKDSLLASTPVSTITVKDKNGKINTLKIFLKLSEQGDSLQEAKVKQGHYDLNFMYAVGKENNLILVQHFVFDKILATYKDFVLSKSKK